MTAPRLFISVMLAVILTGCGASLKDITGPCGFEVVCDPDNPDTWPLPPLKLIGEGGRNG